MLTTMVIVPDGPEDLDKRIAHQVRLGFPASRWMITKTKLVVHKAGILPTKTGVPYWVTLIERDKKSQAESTE